MPGLRPDVDPDGLLEYSVVYTDRALNHMSRRFGDALRGILAALREAHAAEAACVIPGSGTFGMEAVVRQFVAAGAPTLVVRNGWFSFRWTQILDAAGLGERSTVLKARRVGAGTPAAPAPFAPAPTDEIVAAIARERPAAVFVPHVETSSGILMPDAALRAIADAAHAVGAVVVVDAIASGALWLDMRALGVDVVVGAPQKGWSGSPGCAFVMLGAGMRERLGATRSSSFACDLAKWQQIADAFDAGGFAYHTTMPTDALVRTHAAIVEMRSVGFERLRDAQWRLGRGVRAMLARRGFASVAAPGFEAPGVVVSYTGDPRVASGAAFAEHGVQSAAGVPLQCDEGADFRTFRLGLFGLDKFADVDAAVARIERAVDAIAAEARPRPVAAAAAAG